MLQILKRQFQQNFLWYVAITLIAFSTMSFLGYSVFGEELQTQNNDTNECTTTECKLMDALFENFLTQMMPLVGGILAIGLQFARKQGMKISADAEEYIVNATQSFVANQSRFLYKKIRDNTNYQEQLLQGKVPPALGKDALENVKAQLKVELTSDEFSRTTRKMLNDNLEVLIERCVTQHNKELAARSQTLLNQIIPVAVNAALLSFKTKDDALQAKEQITKDVLEIVKTNFDQEYMLFSHPVAEIHIKSKLNELIGSVK